MRHRNSRCVGAISRRSQELAAIVEQTLTQDVRALLESLLTQEPLKGMSVRGKTSASKIPPPGRRFSTRRPIARRLPGSTSTRSASMTSRMRRCETASEFDPQNWWTKWGVILGVAQSPKIQSIKGDKRNGHVAFGTFVGI
jgi:hypothetical protein